MPTLNRVLVVLSRYPVLFALALKLLAVGDRLDWLVIWHRARPVSETDDDAA